MLIPFAPTHILVQTRCLMLGCLLSACSGPTSSEATPTPAPNARPALTAALTAAAPPREPAPSSRPIASSPPGGPHPFICETSNCGGNSPIVNGFPINGLNPNGTENLEHIALVPNSVISHLNNNRKCNGSLDVDKFGLIVTVPGATPCTGGDLYGATFEVENTTQKKKSSLKISDIRVQKRDDGTQIYSYEIVAFDPLKNEWSGSLCDRKEANRWRLSWNDRDMKPYPKIDDLYNYSDKSYRNTSSGQSKAAARSAHLSAAIGASIASTDNAGDNLAIVFRSEIYKEDLEVIHPKSADDAEKGWFNIACLRDSLAKIDMDNIAVHDALLKAEYINNARYQRQRLAALAMMTGKYCNRQSYTSDTLEISWFMPGNLPPDREQCNPWWKCPKIEAAWDENGAICISHTRLVQNGNRLGISVRAFPEGCDLSGCTTEKQIVAALRNECRPALPDCGPRLGDRKPIFVSTRSQ